jgi:NAD(P)-dependent dehydrogenase (short-subunit alcohol dehydrogenase family)
MKETDMPGAQRFANQVAMVTGGASGIGRGIAERFAAEGASVVIADVNEQAGADTVKAIGEAGGKAAFQLLNVTDKAAANAAVEATLQRFGRLDIHVNNAGVVNRAPFLDYSLDAWNTVISVNLTGAFICGQASARAMAKAGSGRIVNISSISGQQGGTGRVAYGASKAPMAPRRPPSSASPRPWPWSWHRTASPSMPSRPVRPWSAAWSTAPSSARRSCRAWH